MSVGPDSVIHEEGQVVPVGITKGELPGSPTRIGRFGPEAHHTACAVLSVQSVRVIDLDPHSQVTRSSVAKGVRRLPLHVQEHVAAANPRVVVRCLLVAEIQREPELLAVVAEGDLDVANIENHDGIAEKTHVGGVEQKGGRINEYATAEEIGCPV